MRSQDTPVWLITGASSGFGRAFAEYALERGYRVAATARDPGKLEDLVTRYPDRAIAVSLDVTDGAQIEAGVRRLMSVFGRIDVLVNNAGYAVIGAVEETPESELRAQMETNFFGAVAMIRAVAPILRAQRKGAVVNISSSGGQFSIAGFGSYSASKFALEGISEALAGELAPFGIKTLIVEPGAFRTAFAGGAMRRMPSMPEYRDTVGKTRSYADGMHDSQAGDPRKAAAAIDRALADESTPLRLQLGGDSVDVVRGHAERLLADLAKWEPIARDTTFDARS